MLYLMRWWKFQILNFYIEKVHVVNMNIGEWKNNGFEIEVNRWDHEIFGKGGKGGLLNKNIIQMIRALLDEGNHPKVQCDHSLIDCRTLDFSKFSGLLGVSRTTVERRIQELVELRLVTERLAGWARAGRKTRIIQSTNIEGARDRWVKSTNMPIDNLTIKIDLKNLPKLFEWKEDDWGGFDLCRVV